MELLDLQERQKLFQYCLMVWNDWNNDTNAHPHVGQEGKIAVVHNGIIENYLEIKNSLIRKGVVFSSDTDTEVIVQLLEYYYKKNQT